MKKSIFRLYTIFITLVFTFAIIYFGVNIYNEITHGKVRTKRRYDHIINTLEKDLNNNLQFNQKYYENLLGDKNDFSFLIIKQNQNMIFSYPSNITDKDIENYKTSKLLSLYSTRLNFFGNIYTISGSLFILRPSQIFYYSKIAFIIILIGTVLTFSMIIYISANEKNFYSDNSDDDSEDELNIFEDDNRNEYLEQFEEQTKISNLEDKTIVFDSADSISENQLQEKEITVVLPKDENPEEENKTEIETIIEQSESKDSSENNAETITENKIDNSSNKTEIKEETVTEIKSDESVLTTEESEKNKIEEASSLESKKETISLPVEQIKPMEIEDISEAPTGLFSPTTGIGWESYLLTRLDNELNRATASEVDLSLFSIRIPNLLRTDPLMRAICDYLTIQFQFKDLIFEYKDDCIVAIKISIDIDEALSFAEKLHEEINEMLSSKNTCCYIGISSRSIRLMSGERLIKEADQALQHAQVDDDSKIIAFRVDPTKYQKFLEEQNK